MILKAELYFIDNIKESRLLYPNSLCLRVLKVYTDLIAGSCWATSSLLLGGAGLALLGLASRLYKQTKQLDYVEGLIRV